MKRLFLIFLLLCSVSIARADSPSPSTQRALETQMRAFFDAYQNNDEASMRGFWQPGDDIELLAKWTRTAKQEQTRWSATLLGFSGWQKWEDSDALRVRFRVAFRSDVQPKTENSSKRLDWIVVCRRVGQAWKWEEFHTRRPDFHAEFSEETTPLERQQFLAIEWGRQPPRLEAASFVDETRARAALERLFDAYRREDLEAFKKCWTPDARRRAQWETLFADDFKTETAYDFENVRIRHLRRRTFEGKTELKWTVKFSWTWLNRGETGRRKSECEWRLTLNLDEPTPRFSARTHFFGGYVEAMQSLSGARLGELWEDDWEIGRAEFRQTPDESLKTKARARVEALLGAFEKQNIEEIRAQWLEGKNRDEFEQWAQGDWKESDQNQFSELRFDHWNKHQDENGWAVRVRMRARWQWRDIKTGKTESNSHFWLWTLRPAREDERDGEWKIAVYNRRDQSIITAIGRDKTPAAWALYLNEQHEFERESTPSATDQSEAQKRVDELIEAWESGDVARAQALWPATNDPLKLRDLTETTLKQRPQNRFVIHEQHWTRIDDTDSLDAPRLRVRMRVGWSWQDVNQNAKFAHQIWDLWLEPDSQNASSTNTSWHLTQWRRRDADFKNAIRLKRGWELAWMLDGERDRLTKERMDEMFNWSFGSLPAKPDDARQFASALQLAARLQENWVQQAFGLIVGAYVANEYFYLEEGNPKRAFDDSVSAASTLVTEGHFPGAARAWFQLAERAAQSRDAASAHIEYRAALRFATEADDREVLSLIRNAIGRNAEKLGLLDEARGHYVQAIFIGREEKDLARELEGAFNAAALRSNRGEIGLALSEMLDGRERAKRAGLASLEWDFGRSIGQIYHATGQIDEAINAYQTTLHAAEKSNDKGLQLDILTLLINAYGSRYLGRGALNHDPDAERAIALMERSSRLVETLVDEKPASRALHSQISQTLLSQVDFMLGWSRISANKRNGAELVQSTEKSLEYATILTKNLANYELQINALLAQSELWRQQKKWDEALRAQEEAAKKLEGGWDGSRIDTLALRGDILRDQSRFDEASLAYRGAAALLEERREGAQDKLLQSGVTERGIEIYQKLAECLQRQNAPGDEILGAVESARARSLTDMMSESGDSNRAEKGVSREQKDEENRLARQVTQLQLRLDSLAGGRNDEQIAQLSRLRSSNDAASGDQTPVRQKLADARRELETFRRQLFLKNPSLQAERAAWSAPTLAQIGAQLFRNRPKRRIISFVVGHESTMLLVLSPGTENGGAAQLKSYSIPVSRQKLIETTQSARKSLSRPSSVQDDWSELQTLLLGPIASELNGASELVIIPDGPLAALPFVALNDENGEFLIEKFTVSYAPGLAALMAMERPRATQKGKDTRVPFVGLSRSQFGEIGLKPLPGAGAEVRAIAPLFGSRAVIAQDEKATKSFARRELPRARWIHLATHGLLNPTAPLYSSVALSPDQTDPDGRLYARDLMNLNLQADLVVLSACETALGQEVRGEGVLGLTWALFVAGAPASVVTQWSVDDAATSALMQKFYAELQTNKSPATALRNAQLALLKSKTMRHPAFWAPFIAVGAAN